jgi:hypothetical protein
MNWAIKQTNTQTRKQANKQTNKQTNKQRKMGITIMIMAKIKING